MRERKLLRTIVPFLVTVSLAGIFISRISRVVLLQQTSQMRRPCPEEISVLIVWHSASVLDGRGTNRKAVCIAVDNISDLFIFIREALSNTHKPCRDPLGLEVFALGTPPRPCVLVMSLCPSKCGEGIERGDCSWTCQRGRPECSAVPCVGR